uniref:Uncharacterized protein n=1 Tax=Pseudenhygromyxa salsuginis TaxID=442868 RepID=A0A3S7UVF4_9BACT|nr:hypothetical protein [Pseudenhygromyxa salsuginis]
MTAALQSFDLRCRDAEWVDDPRTVSETLHAFSRPAELPPLQRHAALSEVLLADLVARQHMGLSALARERPILSCETPRWGIPVGVWDPDAAPAIEQWRLRAELSGELLDPALDRMGTGPNAVLRALIAAAGVLPLLLTPNFAAAAPGVGDRLEMVVAPPKLPDEPQPQPQPEPPPKDGVTPPPTTTAPPMANPPPTTTPPPPAVVVVPAGDESLSLVGKTLWDGLMDGTVSLTMKGGQTFDGTVVAQSTSDLAVARVSDGTVVSVPKAEIAGVRVRAQQGADGPELAGVGPVGTRPTKDGRGLVGAGISMLVVGSAFTLAGTVMLAIYPSGLFINLPLLIPGLGMVAGGAGMMVSGRKRRAAYREAWGLPELSKLQIMPTLGVGRSGGQAGLVMRF